MWKNLPRGLPEAEAAYYDNYNRGRDEFGRKVLNPAEIDLTPAVGAKLRLGKYQNAWMDLGVGTLDRLTATLDQATGARRTKE
jgi:hypothetical protein